MRNIDIDGKFFQLRGSNQFYYCYDESCDRNGNVKLIRAIKVKNIRQAPDMDAPTVTIKDINKVAVVGQGLGMAYNPISEGEHAKRLNTQTPDSMAYDITRAQQKLQKAVGGDVAKFVCDRLHYSIDEISKYLAAEQIDAVAFAIYNIEARNQGFIVGDQTGIGKGRVAAAMIRYGYFNGKIPFFITEKSSLFTDIYRDLQDIDSANLVPFIVNNNSDQNIADVIRTYETGIPDDNGDTTRQAVLFKSAVKEKTQILDSGELPKQFDFIMATYSQFNLDTVREKRDREVRLADGSISTETAKVRTGELKPTDIKGNFLWKIAPKCMFILDEAHNAAGNDSNTGYKLTHALAKGEGTVFLSATYAKRADNMVIYSTQTCIKEAIEVRNHNRAEKFNNFDDALQDLTNSIAMGGITLQEIISSNIVREGQMLRREKEYPGVKTHYVYFNEEGNREYGVSNSSKEHREIIDRITPILRKIDYFSELCRSISENMAKSGEIQNENGETLKPIEKKNGSVGVEAQPAMSKMHVIIAQILLALKIKDIARFVIDKVNNEGANVVVALSKTNETLLQDVAEQANQENNLGYVTLSMTPKDGKKIEFHKKEKTNVNGITIDADFSAGLNRTLRNCFKFRFTDSNENKYEFELEPDDLELYDIEGLGAAAVYREIKSDIKSLISNIDISPIDTLEHELEKAGIRYAEVTGRKLRFEYNEDGKTGVISPRPKESATSAFNRFNQNAVNVLIINQSGSTGKSAHAIPVKGMIGELRKRVMVVAEPELDINTEVQKRGRVNRTGQQLVPTYYYMSTDIPNEKRAFMVLNRKLKSLDSNTSADQNNTKDSFESPDFMNVIGDAIAFDYCEEHDEFNLMIKDPIKAFAEDGKKKDKNASRKNKSNRFDADTSIEDLAKTVSTRCAICPVEMQDDFFSYITERFVDEVDRLKMLNEYTLEVQKLDLKAELIPDTDNVVTEGIENGTSLFSTSAVENEYMCVPINRPKAKKDIDKDIDTFLNGRKPEDVVSNIKKMLVDCEMAKIAISEKNATYRTKFEEIQEKMQEAMNLTPSDEKEIAKQQKQIEKLRNEYQKTKEQEAEAAKKRIVARNTINDVANLLSDFHIGGMYLIPDVKSANAILTSITIPNKLEPLNSLSSFAEADGSIMNLTAGKVELNFAVASTTTGMIKYNLTGEGRTKLVEIAKQIPDGDFYRQGSESNKETRLYMAKSWDKYNDTMSSSKVRMKIITGNILGYYMSKGIDANDQDTKLIEFTTANGAVEKGVLTDAMLVRTRAER